MTTKETDEEFWARVAELPFVEQDRAQLVRRIDVLIAENERLRAAIETAAAMVRNADPDLADALLQRL